MRLSAPHVLLCVLLASCAVVPNQVKQEDPTLPPPVVGCEAKAAVAYPRLIQQVTVTEEQTIKYPIECKLDVTVKCVQADEKVVPAVKISKDVNVAPRRAYVQSCLALQK